MVAKGVMEEETVPGIAEVGHRVQQCPNSRRHFLMGL